MDHSKAERMKYCKCLCCCSLVTRKSQTLYAWCIVNEHLVNSFHLIPCSIYTHHYGVGIEQLWYHSFQQLCTGWSGEMFCYIGMTGFTTRLLWTISLQHCTAGCQPPVFTAYQQMILQETEIWCMSSDRTLDSNNSYCTLVYVWRHWW